MRGGFSRPYDATKTWSVICGSTFAYPGPRRADVRDDKTVSRQKI